MFRWLRKSQGVVMMAEPRLSAEWRVRDEWGVGGQERREERERAEERGSYVSNCAIELVWR